MTAHEFPPRSITSEIIELAAESGAPLVLRNAAAILRGAPRLEAERIELRKALEAERAFASQIEKDTDELRARLAGFEQERVAELNRVHAENAATKERFVSEVRRLWDLLAWVGKESGNWCPRCYGSECIVGEIDIDLFPAIFTKSDDYYRSDPSAFAACVRELMASHDDFAGDPCDSPHCFGGWEVKQ